MITEVIVAKGLLAIGHWAVAHATAGTVALAVKTVAGMTLAQFLTTTVTAGFDVTFIAEADNIMSFKSIALIF